VATTASAGGFVVLDTMTVLAADRHQDATTA
jgi:hypothetical protein